VPITPVPAGAPVTTLRIAAAGDVHCGPARRDEAVAAFAALRGQADLLLLAGDLTDHGEPEEAAVVADACRGLDMPVFAVLGNHDWHADRVPALLEPLREAGVTVLEREHAICRIAGHEVGIAGAKGFVGGFAGSHLPDFGEPLRREVDREAGREADALDAGLKAIATCPLRIALLHYAPIAATLAGEPEPIWTYLGCDRLAGPITQHEPDLVLHGHAHAGTFEGRIGDVPVYNVSVPVMRQPFWVFELTLPEHPAAAVH
jgi:Icc-related predicted phosphoesterase